MKVTGDSCGTWRIKPGEERGLSRGTALHIFPGDQQIGPTSLDAPPWTSSELGTASMEDYRVYQLGPDGHIIRRIDIVCSDEAVARERAQELAENCAAELWQGSRMIAIYQARQ